VVFAINVDAMGYCQNVKLVSKYIIPCAVKLVSQDRAEVRKHVHKLLKVINDAIPDFINIAPKFGGMTQDLRAKVIRLTKS
jgi:hypothetical protein